jgi:hypothetical protein
MLVLVVFEDRQVWCAAKLVIVYLREERRLAPSASRGFAIHNSITPEA